MGCGGSKDADGDQGRKSGSRGMQGVGPNDGSKADASANPLSPPADKSTTKTTTPPSSGAKPRRSGQRTKDLVNSSCGSDIDQDDARSDASGASSTTAAASRARRDDPAAHYDESAVATVLSSKSGTTGVAMAAFSFGDNSKARTLAECGDEASTDIMSDAQVKKRASKVRREGVSAEPILPDAAEKFTPRVVPKTDKVFEEIRCLVSKNALFRALEPEELATVINAMEEERFNNGDVILAEGEMSTNKFYFIVEGAVSITRGGEFICSFTAGNTFGEMELMYLSTCAASVTCTSPTLQTFSLDAMTYRHIVMMVSIRKRKLYKELLGTVPFLASMSDYDAMQLADALETRTFAAGEHLLSFGEKSEWMFLIVDGGVKVVGRDEKSGAKIDVCTFGRGDTVGELEFLNKHPAVADVIATQPTKTCCLHRDHFEMCMGPIVDYLKDNAMTEKYTYYNSVVTEDDEGHKLSHFKFGDDDQDSNGESAGKGSAGSNEAFHAFADTTDVEGTEGGKRGRGGLDDVHHTVGADEAQAAMRAQKKTPRRVGVSDEVMDDDDTWTPPIVPKTEDEKSMLKSVLKTNLLLRSLEGADLDTVVMAMEKKNFAHGTLILEQGGEGGSHYFVITKGVVEILKKGELICTFGEGEGFGEMELMYIQPCVATVRARTDVDTWALDRGTYKRVVMSIAVKRRQLYTELLGGVEFLENMSEYEKGTLADALTPQTYAPGSYIIRRGERNEWMHIIVEGTVEVFGVDTESEQEGRMKHICFLERGACVGELEFLNQHPAVADCVAKTEVRTCTLHRDHFEMCLGPIMDVLRKTVRQEKYAYYNAQLEELAAAPLSSSGTSPSAAAAVAAGAAPRVRQRGRAKAVSAEAIAHDLDDYDPPVIAKTKEQLDSLNAIVRKCPLFSALQAQERAIIIGALDVVSMKKGDVIVQEGDIRDENHWYIVSDGVVEMATAADGIVAVFSPGSSFGELELMYSTAALATTRIASETATLYRLDRRTYQKIVMKVSRERRALYKELLSGIQFLANMSESEQLQLADALSPVHFTPGEYMIRVGQHNEWMFIIVDGVVEVFGKDGSKICDLRRGEMVGELEFLHKHAAVADCVAKTHVQAVRLHREHFEMCMGKVSDFIERTLLQPKYSYYQARRASMQAHTVKGDGSDNDSSS